MKFQLNASSDDEFYIHEIIVMYSKKLDSISNILLYFIENKEKNKNKTNKKLYRNKPDIISPLIMRNRELTKRTKNLLAHVNRTVFTSLKN